MFDWFASPPAVPAAGAVVPVDGVDEFVCPGIAAARDPLLGEAAAERV